MNVPMHTSWSVVPWGRYDTDPPELPPRTVTTPDGLRWEVREPMDPEWHADHWRDGVEIHDHDRGVTYQLTLDDRGGVDFLRVTLTGGGMGENLLRRVPIDRIRRVARVNLNAQRAAGSDEIVFTPPGGVRFDPGRLAPEHRGDKPPLEEIADRMIRLGENRQELAAHYLRNVRSVDGWIRQTRQHGLIPESRRELRELHKRLASDDAQQTTDTDGDQPPDNRK